MLASEIHSIPVRSKIYGYSIDLHLVPVLISIVPLVLNNPVPDPIRELEYIISICTSFTQLTPELVYIVKFISKIYYFYWITKCVTKYRHINAISYICKSWFQYQGFHRVPLRYYYRIFYSTVNVYGNVRLIVF